MRRDLFDEAEGLLLALCREEAGSGLLLDCFLLLFVGLRDLELRSRSLLVRLRSSLRGGLSMFVEEDGEADIVQKEIEIMRRGYAHQRLRLQSNLSEHR